MSSFPENRRADLLRHWSGSACRPHNRWRLAVKLIVGREERLPVVAVCFRRITFYLPEEVRRERMAAYFHDRLIQAIDLAGCAFQTG